MVSLSSLLSHPRRQNECRPSLTDRVKQQLIEQIDPEPEWSWAEDGEDDDYRPVSFHLLSHLMNACFVHS
jgi:hypothetical protein